MVRLPTTQDVRIKSKFRSDSPDRPIKNMQFMGGIADAAVWQFLLDAVTSVQAYLVFLASKSGLKKTAFTIHLLNLSF